MQAAGKIILSAILHCNFARDWAPSSLRDGNSGSAVRNHAFFT